MKAQKNFCILFVEKSVIENLNEFIFRPSEIEFQNVAISMGEDLWKNKIKVRKNEIQL